MQADGNGAEVSRFLADWIELQVVDSANLHNFCESAQAGTSVSFTTLLGRNRGSHNFRHSLAPMVWPSLDRSFTIHWLKFSPDFGASADLNS
jgi:hypothetical protein